MLSGSTEWVAKDPEFAAQELMRLKWAYAEATGLQPQVVRRPHGVTTGGQIDVETGQILVWDDNPAAFVDGYVAEELHHYFQLEEQGLIVDGTSLSAEQIKALEADVIHRLQGSGFMAYNHRNYVPYTNAPRPPGVAGSHR